MYDLGESLFIEIYGFLFTSTRPLDLSGQMRKCDPGEIQYLNGLGVTSLMSKRVKSDRFSYFFELH